MSDGEVVSLIASKTASPTCWDCSPVKPAMDNAQMAGWHAVQQGFDAKAADITANNTALAALVAQVEKLQV